MAGETKTGYALVAVLLADGEIVPVGGAVTLAYRTAEERRGFDSLVRREIVALRPLSGAHSQPGPVDRPKPVRSRKR